MEMKESFNWTSTTTGNSPFGSFIVGGNNNTISTGYSQSFIGGGGCNTINGAASVIVGGTGNSTAGTVSIVGGGTGNSASATYSGVFSGNTNQVLTQSSVIAGGACNAITGCAETSFIGGGYGNCLKQTGTVIGGGFGNQVAGIYSSVLGGMSNSASGAYSSILGGSGNSDGGFNYAGVFGQGITAVAPNTFHVECLNAINTPIYTGLGYLPGTIFGLCNLYPPPVGAYPLYFQS